MIEVIEVPISFALLQIALAKILYRAFHLKKRWAHIGFFAFYALAFILTFVNTSQETCGAFGAMQLISGFMAIFSIIIGLIHKRAAFYIINYGGCLVNRIECDDSF